MIFDGRWKLSKYSTGEVLLFDMETDPEEQHNLLRDPSHREKYIELDTLLTQSIMQSVTDGNHDQRVYTTSLSTDPTFGHRGWRRAYPQRLDGAQ